MKIVRTILEMRQLIREQRSLGKKIGFVPTMGYLHEGHLSLAREAKANCDYAVMSIFVNPLQFGPTEDFERYPRDLERDSAMAESAGIDVLFAPEVQEMYPRPNLTHVEVGKITENLCGMSRPGHFKGVTTVVSKLFNIVQPDQAFFGQKDAQQVRVIQQMVTDLNMPVEIVVCPIVREADGLAMSSRNVYLSSEERFQAASIYKALLFAQENFLQGERSANKLIEKVKEIIEQQPFARIDYIKIVDWDQFAEVETLSGRSLLAVAVYFGKTRLIDNLILEVKE